MGSGIQEKEIAGARAGVGVGVASVCPPQAPGAWGWPSPVLPSTVDKWGPVGRRPDTPTSHTNTLNPDLGFKRIKASSASHRQPRGVGCVTSPSYRDEKGLSCNQASDSLLCTWAQATELLLFPVTLWWSPSHL